MIDDNNASDAIVPRPYSEKTLDICEQQHVERDGMDNQINEVVRIMNKKLYFFQLLTIYSCTLWIFFPAYAYRS